jgi:hypothetical protein
VGVGTYRKGPAGISNRLSAVEAAFPKYRKRPPIALGQLLHIPMNVLDQAYETQSAA